MSCLARGQSLRLSLGTVFCRRYEVTTHQEDSEGEQDDAADGSDGDGGGGGDKGRKKQQEGKRQLTVRLQLQQAEEHEEKLRGIFQARSGEREGGRERERDGTRFVVCCVFCRLC